MKKHLAFLCFVLLGFITYLPSQGQTNSVELKDGSGTLINSYSSVSAAYAGIPATLTKAYVIEIKSTYTGASETYPIMFSLKTGHSATNTITLRPAAGVASTSITSAKSGGNIITIDNADYIIIDGRAGGTGTTRALTINNTATASNTNTIQFINGACNGVVRYCNIGNSTGTNTGRTVHFSTSASNATGNSFNLIEKCKLTGSRYGVNTNGTAGTNRNKWNKIYGCEIVDMVFTGFWIQAGSGSIEIDSNTIYSSTVTGDGIFFGILFDSQTDTAIITRNTIYNLDDGTSTSAVKGICIRSTLSTGVSNYSHISNNFIALNKSNEKSTGIYGITYEGSSSITAEILYNTIRVGGALLSGGTSGNVGSAGLWIDGSNVNNSYVVKNNIFLNDRTGGTAGLQHTAFAVTDTSGTLTMNYNTYNSVTGDLVRWGSTVYTTMAAYKAIMHGGNEFISNAKPVTTVSLNDLHLAGASLGEYEFRAIPILSVLRDIDNDPRGTLTYRGGDDNPAYPLVGELNDIGVTAINEPAGGTCSSPATVKVTVENFGVNQVDTFRVNWSVNGVVQAPVDFYTVVLDTILGSGNINAQVTLGSFTTVSGVNYTIKAWTSNPNNMADTSAGNDTARKIYRMALAAGTYTVGGTSPDFADLTSVVTTLNNYGVCGPVVFNIRNGVYNEKIPLGTIAGTSGTNTITFQSESGDSTAVVISSAADATAVENYTVSLNGSSNIILKNLTIERTGSGAYSTVVSLTGLLENIKIQGNIIRGPYNVTTDTDGDRSDIYGSLTTVTKNVEIFNNRLENNSNGVWLNTASSSEAVYSSGTSIYNNIVTPNYTGIFVAGQHNPQIYNNRITRFDMSVNIDYYGISLNKIDSSMLVANNYSLGNRGYGIRLRDCFGYSGNEGRIINNMVSMVGSGTATVYGITLETHGMFLLYAHNTALMDYDYTSTSTNAGARAFYAPTGTANAFDSIRVLNNIFYNKRDGLAAYFVTGSINSITELDYNLYYSADISLTYVSAYQTDLASYKLVSGKEEHGFNVPLTFVSSTDPHLVFMQKFTYGRNDLNVTTDFDGNPRCVPLPTVGADEYNTSSGLPVATFIGPNAPVTGDRAYFLYNGNINQAALYKWYVNGVLTENKINFTYIFPAAGNYEIMQIAENCEGLDTFIRNYTIADPTTVPTANFSVNRNQIFVNEIVQFTDLSLGGPTAWHWKITPDNGTSIIYSDSTEQDPSVLFTAAGKYTVCLIVDNAIGGSAPRCRSMYIEVYPQIDMCAEKVSTFEKGRIFDDGGSGGSYKANMDCSFFINPCASEVTLKFTEWTNTDADDKLTIYDGDTSDPANIIAVIAGGMTNPGGTTGFTAKSGRMWLKWKTDASLQYAGFTAEWSSTPATINPTVANFNAPDTAYTNSPVRFTNTSSGSGLLFFWDFDFPNYEPSDNNTYSTVNPVKTYPFAGTYTVLLESTNCLGKDSVFKQIVVVDPTMAPVADFSATLTKLNIREVNQLMDQSANGPSSWRWEIDPPFGVQFIDPETSPNPRILFNFGGTYTVKLWVSNAIGADSLVKTSFIEVLEYCRPNVSTVNTDVTIRRVVFEEIDQSSDYGVNTYNDFSLTANVAAVAEGATYPISIERNTNNELVNFAVWMDFNQDGDFEDADERVLFDSASLDQIHNGTIEIPAGVMLGETRMRVAVARANLTTQPCGPVVVGEYEDYKVRITVDDEPPVITVKGNNPEYVEVGYGYLDSGATAMDNVDGNLTSMIMTSGSVDTLTVGTYTITYKVTDARGNTDSATRTVYVTPDATAPVISLNGNDTVVIEVYDMYMEDGATAVDNPFGTMLTDSIMITGMVDTAKVGTYVLTYTVKDAMGNTATTTRVVIVKDTEAPVIVLNGNDVIDHDVNIPYVDAGATVTDNYYNGLTYTVSGTVNVNKLGTYVLTFDAVDSSGNVAVSITRTINVVDRVAPVIQLVGSDVVYLARWQDYTDSGYTLSDNYYDSAGITVDTLGNWTNASVEGLYYIQYRATDSSGNVSLSSKRVIYVNGYNSVAETVHGETNVYPNPNTGRFTIETSMPFAEGTVISITSVVGARIYEAAATTGESKVQVNLEGISPGVYFVNITTKGGTQTTKIVIQ